jgi:hypothetical protein
MIDGTKLAPAEPGMLLIALRLNEEPRKVWRDRFLVRARRAYKRSGMNLAFCMGDEGTELRVLVPQMDGNRALEAVESAMADANLAPSKV